MDNSAHKCRILLVEDHEDTRAVTARLLRRHGYSVADAADCASALRYAAQERFDLLIADLGLPDGTGLELLPRMRELYPIAGIVLSGHDAARDGARSKSAGFARYLTKPVNADRLFAAIDEVTASRLMHLEGGPDESDHASAY